MNMRNQSQHLIVPLNCTPHPKSDVVASFDTLYM